MRYKLHAPPLEHLEHAARWLRRLDDQHIDASEIRAHCARVALPPEWRTRDRLREPLWPARTPDNIHVWAAIGASDALSMTPPRAIDQRTHALAYTAAWTAVMEAYMSTAKQSMSDAINEPSPMDSGGRVPMMGPWRTSAHLTPLLDEAMCVAQEMIEAAPKSANNPHFNTRYADLSSVIAAIKPACTAARIARYQPAWTDDKPGVIVTTRLAHKGEWCEADLRIPVDKSNAQALGSAITYGRRYGLSTAFGVPTEDDDGNQAAASPPPDRRHSTSPPKRADLCDPKTATAIGTLCGQIAQHVGRDDVDRLTVLRTALTKTGHQYNDDIKGAKNLDRAEALLVHPWLINDLKTYVNEGDQSEPPFRGES